MEALRYEAGPVGGSEGSTGASEEIIRLNGREDATFFVVKKGRNLAVKGKMENHCGNRRDQHYNQRQHRSDEPRRTRGVLRRWLGDAEDVDKGIG